LQLRALKAFLETYPQWKEEIKMVIIGGCRNVEDEKRLEILQKLANEWQLSDIVEFKPNLDYKDMKKYLGRALIGLHAMWNEHFGIGIVESMAAAVIPLAHQSGGPQMDIVVDHDGGPTGFMATTPETYADAMHKILSLSTEDAYVIQKRARSSATQRFSEESFKKNILKQLSTDRFPLIFSVFQKALYRDTINIPR
jgi:alpha-1,2-mannosyltransferase